MSDDRLLRVSMNAAEEKVEPIRKTRIVSTYRNDFDDREPVPLKSKPRDRRRYVFTLLFYRSFVI